MAENLKTKGGKILNMTRNNYRKKKMRNFYKKYL